MKGTEHIIPTVFAHNKKEFGERFNRLVRVSEVLQIDFMDGKLVPAKSVALKDVPDLNKYEGDFEAHLMVREPLKWARECKKKGFKRAIFHIESVKSTKEAESVIVKIDDLGLGVYVAINPETPLERIYPMVEKGEVDGVLIMGVHPGKEGQELADNTADRVREIKRLNNRLVVQVDGGINDKTIGEIASAGVNFVNCGSYIGNAKDPKKAIEKLTKLFIKKHN